MCRTLLAGTAAVALLLAPAKARADVFSDILDALTEVQEGDLEGLAWQLLGYFGIYGSAIRSYLATGQQVWNELFPDEPDYLTVDEATRYADERLEDRKSRVEEAMGVASLIVQQQPVNQLKMAALQAANVSPVSLFAAIQIGNEMEAEGVLATHKMNGLLAELGQLEADQRLAEDWERVMAAEWIEAHYEDNAYWAGERTWEPEPIDTGW